MTPTSRRTSIRTPTVRQKRCIRAQLSSSSLQKILTEQGMLEIDPLTLGPRNGDDAASPTGHSRNFKPSAEPQDELPRDRRAIVAPVTVGSYGDAAIVDGELPGLLRGGEGYPAAAPWRERMHERVGDEQVGDEREQGHRADRKGLVRCHTGQPRTARSAEPRGKNYHKGPAEGRRKAPVQRPRYGRGAR
jgi:hypothetical protein